MQMDLVKKTMRFENCKKCLLEGTRVYRSQLLFRSTKRKIKTLEVNKLALSREDDKRVIKRNGISSYAMGHYEIRDFMDI